VSGEPPTNDEAAAAGWFTAAEPCGLGIHPTQWRHLRNWLAGTYPHAG